MSGLRQRQKADRRRRIIVAARDLFSRAGYESATIEAIAEAAEVSGVTVHNYFGTKAGVLLALVAESDSALIERMRTALAGQAEDLTGLVLAFAAVIREHALANLDKRIWRQVIAAATLKADSPFGRAYHALDRKLALTLVPEIEALAAAGKVSPAVPAEDLALALFQLQNARFVEFVASERLTGEEADARLKRDLQALFGTAP